MKRPSPAMAVALTALVIASAGTAMAGVKLVSGDSLIKKGSLSGNRLRIHTLTAKQINVNKLGTVPHATNASHATNADLATTAQNANNATNASGLAGHPGSSYLLTGTSGEAFHLVGGIGEPAFQNSWANYNNGFAPAAFYIDPIGRVHLKGIVTGPNPGSLVFTLPAGYRPPEDLAFAVAAGTPGPTPEDVDVLSDGEVITDGAATTAVALDGISFRVN